MTSEQLFERSLKVCPGGVHSPVRAFKGMGRAPLFFTRADGPYLHSVEDEAYIDFCQSFGPNILGHRDPEVQEIVEQAIKEAWSFGACEPYSLELCEFLVNEVSILEKIRLVNSGTEAVLSALRVARAATGRRYILKFEGCYHGHGDSMLVKAGSGLAGLAASDSAGVSKAQAEETLVCPLDDIESLKNIFDQYGSEIAAVIVEPLPANFGLLVQTEEFFATLKDLVKNSGALLIFDEVISGFRVGMEGMAGELGLLPDLVTYGKVIGGGFPIGAYGGRKDLMDLVAPAGPVYQAGTLSANPIGCRAGLVTLKKLKREGWWQKLAIKTQNWVDELNAAFKSIGAPFWVSSKASLFWIHDDSQKDYRSPSQFPPHLGENFRRLFLNSLQHNIYLAPSAFEVGFVSAAHTDEVMERALNGLVQAAKDF